MSLTDVMSFDDLTPIEVPVQIRGEKYVLCEATGEAAARFRNHAMACTTFGPDGKPTGVKGLGDLQILLVSLCLYKVVAKGSVTTLERVSTAFVQNLSERIVKPLFERAKAISELGEDADESVAAIEKQIAELQVKLEEARKKEEALKNEQSSTEDVSNSLLSSDSLSENS